MQPISVGLKQQPHRATRRFVFGRVALEANLMTGHCATSCLLQPYPSTSSDMSGTTGHMNATSTMSSSSSRIDVNGQDDTKDNPRAQPVSVLFVCLSNICRSTMAEAVFRSLTKAHPGISRIDSTGTAAYYHEGEPPDSRTLDTLGDNGIDDYDHEARKTTIQDLVEFDYILAMDKQNLSDLARLKNQMVRKDPASESRVGKIMLFGDFGGKKGEQVVDPYYGARDGFSIAYEQMVRFSNGYIEQVLDSQSQFSRS